MVREDKSTWKANYFTKITQLFDQYPKCFIVGVDNVGSKQMQEIRKDMRGHAEILMGKNTMIRKAIQRALSTNPTLEKLLPHIVEKLLPHIVENIGFVFTKEDLGEIREKLVENRKAAPAKVGAIAPCDVTLPPHNTGMGPEKTAFWGVLQIPTKISRGTIEILNEVHLIKAGDRVGASEAGLLNMMGIQPFSYGLVLRQVYDTGTVYSPTVLDLSIMELRRRFLQEVDKVAAVSLGAHYPTIVSVVHSVASGLQNMICIASSTDVTFKEVAMMKEFLADPSKFTVEAAPATTDATALDVEIKKEEAMEESDDDMGFGLFD